MVERYKVAADPVPITTTLTLPAFQIAIALLTVFFLAATALERRAAGQAATRILTMAPGCCGITTSPS